MFTLILFCPFVLHIIMNFIVFICSELKKRRKKTWYYELCIIYFFRIKEKIAKTFDNLDDINIFSLATLCIYRKFIYFITVLLRPICLV